MSPGDPVIDALMRQARDRRLAGRRRALVERFGLRERDPAERSAALCDWIAAGLETAEDAP